MSLTKIDEAVYQTLAYSNIFHYPLSESEIFQRLVSPIIISSINIKKSISDLCKKNLIQKFNNYYYIQGNNFVNQRLDKDNIAKRKLNFASKSFKKISKLPWIRTILITGSIAAGNADINDDIDILVITSPNRLWIVRLLLLFYLEILGLRRRPNDIVIKDKICLNILLDSLQTQVIEENHSIYTAYEILQSKVIFDSNNGYAFFLNSNIWVSQYLANWYHLSVVGAEIININQRYCIFKSIIGSILNQLNSLLFILQTIFMKKRKTSERVTYYQAFFHPKSIAKQVIQSFELLKNPIY